MLSIVSAASAFAPPAADGAAFARSMVSTITWGTLTTSSTRSSGTNLGTAFGNPYSIADVGGVPYVYASGLDASATDLFGMPSSSPLCTLTLSQATMQHANGTAVFSACGAPLPALKRDPRMFLCAVPEVCLRPGGRDRHSARRPREPALRPPCAHGLYGQPHLRSGRGEGGTCGALRPPSILFAPVRLPVQRVKGRGGACRGEAGGRGGERRRDGGGEGLTHYRAFAAAYRRPAGHGFFVAKLKLTGLWLIDRYGGAATISPTDYFSAAGTAAALPAVSKPAPAALSAVSAAAAAVSAAVVAAASAAAAPAPVPRGETAEAPPWFSDKAATARWMVQNLQVHLTLTLTLTLTPTLTPTPTPTPTLTLTLTQPQP